ncbi:MAG: type II toxin-antitoxin system PemK/MazF family toxin [Eubacteriales bacterium]|nr:type II toxin-antitoxin system PemK/MazF family toxin [Eubacteriales bacterium]
MTAFQWHIYQADLTPVKGSGQSGTRPVLVISTEEVNEALPVVAVLPLTSLKPKREIYPTEALLEAARTGLPMDSIAMAHQIRTISKSRLAGEYGIIDDENLKNSIRMAIKTYLDL